MMDLPYFDWPLNYELSRYGRIKFLNFPSGVYRYHGNSVFSLLPLEEREKISSLVKEKISSKHLEYERNSNK